MPLRFNNYSCDQQHPKPDSSICLTAPTQGNQVLYPKSRLGIGDSYLLLIYFFLGGTIETFSCSVNFLLWAAQKPIKNIIKLKEFSYEIPKR